MPKTFIAEIAPVGTPLPANARVFVLLEAETVDKAADALNGLAIIRHDRPSQLDLYERRGRDIGPKLWSGLHRPPRHALRLSVVA